MYLAVIFMQCFCRQTSWNILMKFLWRMHAFGGAWNQKLQWEHETHATSKDSLPRVIFTRLEENNRESIGMVFVQVKDDR